MLGQEGFCELLAADLALEHGASASTVSGALSQFLDDERTGVLDLLGDTLDAEARSRIDRQLEKALTAAEGDACLALTRRGGLDRSIHQELQKEQSHALKTCVLRALHTSARAVPSSNPGGFESNGRRGSRCNRYAAARQDASTELTERFSVPCSLSLDSGGRGQPTATAGCPGDLRRATPQLRHVWRATVDLGA